MLNLIKKFSSDESGAAAVEYGLLIALIAAALVGTITLLTGGIENAFTAVTNALNAAVPGA